MAKVDWVDKNAPGHVPADWRLDAAALNALGADVNGRQPVATLPEAVQDIVAAMVVPGTNITKTYDDAAGTLTVAATGAGGGATNLAATLSASQTIVTSDTGTDATIPSVDATNAGVMTPTQKTKLDGIEALADVTDAANVTAAGAIMDGDFSTNGILKRTGAGAYGTAVTGTDYYNPGGADVSLADGGTGSSLADPNADRIMFWDDSAGATTWLTPGTNLSITGTTLNATGSGGGSGAAGSGLINVRDTAYGALGNGVADDSAAFLAAFTEAATNSVSSYTPERRGTRTIYIPPGTYLINQPEKFMADLSVAAMRGIKWLGAGRDVTFIVFSPSTANQYMLRNPDDFIFLTFEDMTFHSTVSTASWMLSNSTGLAQNYVFNRVNWSGTWKYGIHLTGSNNNSEMSWFHCGIYNDWTSFLFAPTTGASDQFLNYNFFACQNEVTTGNFVDLGAGGNVNVFGGSLIHIGNGSQTTSAAQCFFRLGVGVSGFHANGVTRALVVGARIEHRHEASQLIKCDWAYGNVTFLSCNTEALEPSLTTPTNVIQAEFGDQDNWWPSIVFDNCSLMGKHKYHYGAGTTAPAAIAYKNCYIAGHTVDSTFITYTNDGGGASPPAIDFNLCVGDATTIIDNMRTNRTLLNSTLKNYTESVVAIGTVTSSNTISLTNGTLQTATLTASTACTFTMPTATAGKSFTLLLKQAASTGNGTATFTGVKWASAGTPTITATAGKMDILSFVSDGASWYGSYTQGYTP